MLPWLVLDARPVFDSWSVFEAGPAFARPAVDVRPALDVCPAFDARSAFDVLIRFDTRRVLDARSAIGARRGSGATVSPASNRRICSLRTGLASKDRTICSAFIVSFVMPSIDAQRLSGSVENMSSALIAEAVRCVYVGQRGPGRACLPPPCFLAQILPAAAAGVGRSGRR